MTVKELKTNNMGYTPYKMQADNNDPMTKNYGAVAPGKMRAFGVDQKDGPDSVSKKSGILYAQGGVGSSPAKGFFGNIFKGAKKLVKKVGGKVGGALGLGGDTKALEGRVSALEASAGESSGEATAVGGGVGMAGNSEKKAAMMEKFKAGGFKGLAGNSGGGGGKMGSIVGNMPKPPGQEEEGMDPSAVAYKKKK
jgi:hypothetical protein